MTLHSTVALCLAGAAASAYAAGIAMTIADPKPLKGAGGQMLVYVGTYTDKNSKGIYAYRLDQASGKLTPLGLAAETPNPTFLALHPNHRFLYAVNEVGEYHGKKSGSVSAYKIDIQTGRLTLINSNSSVGTGPCHVTVDRKGKNVLVANYGSGSVAVLPVRADGSLGPPSCFIQHDGSSVDKSRQEGPHAHSVNLDAANSVAFVADLGLDKLFIYRFDAAKGTIAPSSPPFVKLADGAGPRHFSFHPTGKYAYVINELDDTVTAMSYNAASQTLTPIQTITTLPAGYSGKSYCAEVKVHPNGKFLYGSNRGHDSLAIFSIDQDTGRLTPVGQQSTLGKFPRNFNITPSGDLLLAANQDSDSIFVFRVDRNTGRLTPTGEKVEVSRPVCILFVPVDK